MRLKAILLIAAAVALGMSTPASAAVQLVLVVQSLGYQQTGPSTVTPQGGGANAQFLAFVTDQTPTDFNGGSLTFPGPSSPLTLSNLPQSQFYFSSLMSPSGLAAAFPSGPYTFDVTNSGTSASQVVTVSYFDDLAPIVVPELSPASFSALQNLNASSGITLSINTFTPDPRATSTVTELTFFDVTTNSGVPAPGNPFGFFGDTIAPDTFTAGDTYRYTISFDNEISSSPSAAPVLIASGQTLTVGSFTVSSVPEPATWGLMLIGIASLGAMMRGRRRRPVVAR